jgi:hypothetical protein
MSNTAIQKAETGAIVASTPGQIITGLAALIATPGLGIEAMSAILAAEERMVDRQAEREFNQAMCDCQDEMVPVVRDATNQHTKSKYARLETIDRQIRPIYTKHGFALSFSNPTMSDGKHLIECKVMHRGGHT